MNSSERCSWDLSTWIYQGNVSVRLSLPAKENVLKRQTFFWRNMESRSKHWQMPINMFYTPVAQAYPLQQHFKRGIGGEATLWGENVNTEVQRWINQQIPESFTKISRGKQLELNVKWWVTFGSVERKRPFTKSRKWKCEDSGSLRSDVIFLTSADRVSGEAWRWWLVWMLVPWV